MRQEMVGFAPDLDPSTPGVLVDCDNWLPSVKGFGAGPSTSVPVITQLVSPPKGGVRAVLLDGTVRTIVGTTTDLLEVSGGAWVNRGTGFTGAAPWRFTVFGNQVLATNRAEVIRQSAPSAAFVAIPGAPTAGVITSASNFVLAFDTLDPLFGDSPDRWWCSALFNQADWVPSIATQCASARLVETPGRIRAAHALGPDVVAYKDESMYVGRYVGPPLVWAWQRVEAEVGAPCQEAVVAVDNRHYFIGNGDIYEFDGTVPRPMGSPLRQWFFGKLQTSFKENIRSQVDYDNFLIYWYFPTGTSSVLGRCDDGIVYNYRTGHWGRIKREVLAVLPYQATGVTYDGYGSLFATWDTFVPHSYDSGFWTAGRSTPALFGPDQFLRLLTGPPGPSYFVTGDVGDYVQDTRLVRVTPEFLLFPTTGTATATGASQPGTGGEPTDGATSQMSLPGRFDFRKEARKHRIRCEWPGAVAIKSLDHELLPASPR